MLVLGIGNELLGDDGVGVVAARKLAETPIPGVNILDGGTLGLMLMPYLAGRHAVLVLDAVATEHGKPGDIVVIPDGDVRRGHGVHATAHDVGLVDALAATELSGCAPPHVALVGIVPDSIADRWGSAISSTPAWTPWSTPPEPSSPNGKCRYLDMHEAGLARAARGQRDHRGERRNPSADGRPRRRRRCRHRLRSLAGRRAEVKDRALATGAGAVDDARRLGVESIDRARSATGKFPTGIPGRVPRPRVDDEEG